MQNALLFGQRPTGELVDAYRNRCTPIRNMFVRYLDERWPGIYYSTLGSAGRSI